MAEWSRGSYYNGVVKEKMESGEFVVLADVDKNGDGTMANCDVVDYLKNKGEVRVDVSVYDDLQVAAVCASAAAVAAAAAMAYMRRGRLASWRRQSDGPKLAIVYRWALVARSRFGEMLQQ
jgi:mevalonate pyrophosphate decarboxylase